MCFINIWLLPDTGDDTDFPTNTRSILGVFPETVDLTVDSPKVAAMPRAVAVSPRMCDCRSLIGSPDDCAPGELTYSQIRAWLDFLAESYGRKARIGLIRAWSPRKRIQPDSAMSVRLKDISEEFLRGLEEKQLVVIRFSQW
ncbi:MAG: hypothetical protein Q4C87_10980 [Actinomycetaceae bacterium]|nr:hypothetical protein [Actinomycetaceae bacterium]